MISLPFSLMPLSNLKKISISKSVILDLSKIPIYIQSNNFKISKNRN